MVRRLGTAAMLALAGAAVIVGAAGCTAPVPVEPTEPSRPTPTGSSAAEPATPSPGTTLRPGVGASENLVFFDSVNAAVVVANPEAGGRDFIDALVAAGFDKSQMQVTADRTTIDLRADSVQFAVLFEGECLVGQYGPASGGYHGAVRPALGAGGCLVGRTRPIDW